jgi:hypothetical protein
MSISNGETRHNWKRVTRDRRCPVCGRPDWCLYAGPEGDPTAAICARTESAKRCGEAGWLHRLRDDPSWQPARRMVRTVALPRPVPLHDLANLAASYRTAVRADRLHALAQSLGLSVEALAALNIGWSATHRAWSFPMLSPTGCVLGIRLRRPGGFKFAVKGGGEGLFVPEGATEEKSLLLVCEGPTDTAALLDMGFRRVVGRPSCTSGVQLLAELVRRRQPPEVVIVSGDDEPGRLGAGHLASVLVAYAPTVRVIAPPEGIKDARDWRKAGGTRADVEKAIGAAPVRRLAVQGKVFGMKR